MFPVRESSFVRVWLHYLGLEKGWAFFKKTYLYCWKYYGCPLPFPDCEHFFKPAIHHPVLPKLELGTPPQHPIC